VKAIATTPSPSASTEALPLSAHCAKPETLNQVFSMCELAHSVRSRSAGQSGCVEGLAMTESAKRRITGDVVILAIGLAILIVLAFVGAL
jgi:hypothetical protein